MDRVGLFLLLAETAVSMVAAAAPASSMVTQGDETAVALCLFSGLILFALDVLAGRRLEPVLSAHKKGGAGGCGRGGGDLRCLRRGRHDGKRTYTFDSAERVWSGRRISLRGPTR